jgi:hypothetical protein
MRQVGGDDRTLKQLMRRHIIFDQQAQIDDGAGHN